MEATWEEPKEVDGSYGLPIWSLGRSKGRLSALTNFCRFFGALRGVKRIVQIDLLLGKQSFCSREKL